MRLQLYRFKYFLITLIFISFQQGDGRELPSKIDKNDLRNIIETLSSAQFEGRAIDNDGQLKTQEFIINRFKALQVEPFSSDGYLEKFTLVRTGWRDRYEISDKPIPATVAAPTKGNELAENKRFGWFKKRKNSKATNAGFGMDTDEVEITIETANVVGILRGQSDTSIIISAHYDHIGVVDTELYPGADDNASGIAALLELAEEYAHYKNLNYSIIFLAVSAEESGLLGSKFHVEKPDFDPGKVICNLTIDMISRCIETDCNYLYCVGNDKTEWLDSLVREADRLYPDCYFDYSENASDIYYRSDGYSFMKKGIPSLMFFSGLHEDYHQPTDTADKIDFDLLEKRVRLISEVIWLLQK